MRPLRDGLQSDVLLRRPRVEDGKRIWELVRETGTLDLNSAYSYLMLGKYFSNTCVVGEINGHIDSFLSAFLLPDDNETIFVWQVAVAASQRGQGLGTAMLRELLARDVCQDVRFLETTVTPSNGPSTRLFHGLAKRLGTRCEISVLFDRHTFLDAHEEEQLFRIGPFKFIASQGGYQ